MSSDKLPQRDESTLKPMSPETPTKTGEQKSDRQVPRQVAAEQSLAAFWGKLHPQLPKFLPAAIGILVAVFFFRGFSSRDPDSKYMAAVSKKDFASALKFAKQVGSQHKDPALGSYLSAHVLLEAGRPQEALSEAEAALQTNNRREHGMLKARILYRMGRDDDAALARMAASRSALGTWSVNEWPHAHYYVTFAASIGSVHDRLEFLRANQNFQGFKSLMGEVDCLDAPSSAGGDASASQAIALALYVGCLKQGDWKSSNALYRAMSTKQQKAITKLRRDVAVASGTALAAENLLCWAPCLAKQDSISTVPRGNFSALRALLLELEDLADSSRRQLDTTLKKYKSSTGKSTDGSVDSELVVLTETNIRLLGEFKASCQRLREWSYSTEVLKRRTDSGEALFELVIRGYFGDIGSPIREYRGTRDAAFVEFSKIMDNFQEVERQRRKLYATTDSPLDKYFQQSSSQPKVPATSR